MYKLFAAGLLSLLTSAVLVAADDPPKKKDIPVQAQPAARTKQDVEGWTIRVDDRLLAGDNEALGKTALKFIEAKLFELKAVVPAARVKDLQTVTIVLDLECGDLKPMQYHPDAGWLKAHGFSPELAKCVHLPRAVDVATRRNIDRKSVV